jgi:hypothetical protein
MDRFFEVLYYDRRLYCLVYICSFAHVNRIIFPYSLVGVKRVHEQ